MNECPECGQELTYEDYYGRICAHQDGVVIGDIFRCQNEECSRHGDSWHTKRDEGGSTLHEGYPV